MISDFPNRFLPNYGVPPGETLQETLDARGMTQAELAERTGRPKKTINEIVAGKASITPETALQLERVLGVPARFWNSLERNYRETLARLDERKTLRNQIEWLRSFPVREMMNLGWIPQARDKVDILQSLLSFFGVASIAVWEARWSRKQARFRRSKSVKSNPFAVAAWLRRGELLARQRECLSYDASRLQKTLDDIRRLTLLSPEDFEGQLVTACARAGVAMVFIPELPKTRTHGATYWLAPEKAVIQLSLRYAADDQFWFSFFHEAVHVLKHEKSIVFLEGDGNHHCDEIEADDVAAELLVPKARLSEFVRNPYYRSADSIRRFASSLGIAPGIVVGRLQHDGLLPFTHLNGLKRKFAWRQPANW